MARIGEEGEVTRERSSTSGYAKAAIGEFLALSPEDRTKGLFKDINEFGLGRNGEPRLARTIINAINTQASKDKLPVVAFKHSNGMEIGLGETDVPRTKRKQSPPSA